MLRLAEVYTGIRIDSVKADRIELTLTTAVADAAGSYTTACMSPRRAPCAHKLIRPQEGRSEQVGQK